MNLLDRVAPPGWTVEDFDRSSGLGGSEVAKACGLLPEAWEDARPEDLAAAKLGLAPGFTGNERSYWGSKFEPLIADRVSELTGHVFHRLKTIVHPEHPWAFATPDRWNETTDGLLQIKCTRFRSKDWGAPGTGEVPVYVAAQCSWELWIADREVCDVALLVGGNELQMFTVHRDRDLERRLFEKAKAFWFNQVVARKAA